jgi:hypothetical protein
VSCTIQMKMGMPWVLSVPFCRLTLLVLPTHFETCALPRNYFAITL